MVSWRAPDGVPISGKSVDSSRNFRTLNAENTLLIAIETFKKYIGYNKKLYDLPTKTKE